MQRPPFLKAMSIDSRSAELECTLLELLKQQPTADVAATELDSESDCELTTTDESASEEDNTTVDPRLVRLHGSWWKGNLALWTYAVGVRARTPLQVLCSCTVRTPLDGSSVAQVDKGRRRSKWV